MRFGALLVIAGLLPLPLPAESESQQEASCNVEFEVLLERQSSGLAVETGAVIENRAEWCHHWELVHAGVFPAPPCDVTLVDFDEEIVILVALGSRPDGCHTVDVTCVHRSAGSGELSVVVTETAPGPRCTCTQQVVQPVEAVKIDRPAGAARFRRNLTVTSCE
jgi:hypothetical protein